MLGPIFVRELVTVPRRRGHFPTRVALIGLISVLGITLWQATIGFTRVATIGEAARFGQLLFQLSVFVELLLLLFFAVLSASSTVSQEKDRRTFILLLLTDMRDYEIVLGKLVGSLLPLTVVLLTAVPLLALMLLLGGIDPEQLIQATFVMGTAAYAAGSLGGLIALWREKTFQSLALSVLLLVLYFTLLQAAMALGAALLPDLSWPIIHAWFDPFQAMRTVLAPAPDGWSPFAPAYGFALVMFAACVVLNGWGILKLRLWNPSGEPIMQREGAGEEDPEAVMTPEQLREYRSKAHAAPGAVRTVGENPVLWRETQTFAYGRRPLLVKLAFGMVLSLIVYAGVYDVLNASGGRPAFAAAYGLVPVAVLAMLLIAAQAVTSITSERDGGALDVLLVTDISPREFIFGKLLGVIWNTKEYLIPPLLLAFFYATQGALTKTADGAALWDRLLENFVPMLTVIGAMIVLFAFAMTLGIHVALRIINSRMAIVNTLGTVFFLSVGTLICIYLIVINGGSFANQWLSFISFLVLGIGGLLWVLSADRPSPALSLGSTLCPLAMFYCVTNILIAKPGTDESSDPIVPFLLLGAAFGFTVYAMLLPLVTEFDVALGRTTTPNEE
ncbi:MAG: ABC transporter permease [Gemmataceae bacterium]